jgi:hypothetical protein
MRQIVGLFCILAVSLMVVGGALADGSNVKVSATVDTVTITPEITGGPYSLTYNAPSHDLETDPYVGDYKNTEPIQCNFASNSEYGVDLAVNGEPLSGTIAGNTVSLLNPIGVAWTEVPGTVYTQVPYTVHFVPSIYQGFLEFSQRMEFADPAGTYSGTLTVTLTESPPN